MKDFKEKVLAIPDLHFPFCNHYSLSTVYKAIKKEKPTVIIQLGDLLDQYVFSKYSRDLNLITPEIEIRKGFEKATLFWEKINKIAPKARKIQLRGNHDARLHKRVMERLPEIITLVDEEFYSFDNVEVKRSDRDYEEIDGVIYCHGFASAKFAHVNYFGKSVVRGHSHRAALHVRQSEKTGHAMEFELEAGNLINENSLPFRYTASMYSKWKKAYAIIDKGFPRLVIL